MRTKSPAVNAGSANATQFNVLPGQTMADYTTRTDSNSVDAGDAGRLDIGFHYIDIEPNWPRKFELTTTVLGGHGNIEPPSGQYYAGTTIELTALPDPGWRVNRWTGTDDDSSTNTTNYVVMIGNRVCYRIIRTAEKSLCARRIHHSAVRNQRRQERRQNYSCQRNIFRARDQLSIYSAGAGYLLYGKNITITGTNPDDPCVVAQTILHGESTSISSYEEI